MNKNIVITGGAKGIGAAMVETFAKDGNHVLFSYNKSEKAGLELAERLNKVGCKVDAIKADLSNIDEIKKLAEYAKEKLQHIDVLINNAGIDQFKLFTDITENDWNEIINTNLRSAVFLSKEISKEMIKQKEGCIINISSIWGTTGASCEVLYSISKAGMDGLTKALAKELSLSNIRVNSIAPGAIDTDMNKDIVKEEIVNEIPLGRFGKPEDIAKCARWLVDDEYTTGQVISPNGGWLI
ncbi:MAG: SDR family NAD(P)-dependent oxidoreductase [Clostridia bacterium]|nr:SDR family NAD(P)-dependent oxidoreductase [Clostridia bacterium]